MIAVRSAGEGSHGANVDAGPAFIAFQMIVLVGNNFGNHAAVADSKSTYVHAFIAGAHAAVAENAARCVKKHHRRPLFFVGVDLAFDKTAFARAVAEHHVLQFALAALVAHWAIERMIGE